MQAVILAAGLGTRMGELTKDTPKPLLQFEGKTLLEHNLSQLPAEIDEVIIVIGYLAEKIRKKIGESFNEKKITYVEQKELAGTAKAMHECKDLLHDRFLVFHGDDLYGAEDFSEMARRQLAILVWEMKENKVDSDLHALVKVGEDGQLLDIIERQPAKQGMLVNTGCYVLNMKFFDYPLVFAGTPATEYGLPQTMLQMVRAGEKFDIVKARSWRKVTTSQDLT